MNFVLVSDAVTANFVRAELANSNWINTKVGNFQALLESLCELWLLPKQEDTFSQALHHQALAMPNAFWADSIKVDELAVVKALEQTARQLLSFIPVGEPLQHPESAATRYQHYYSDLITLLDAINVLPGDLRIATEWLALAEAQPQGCIDTLNLYVAEPVVHFEPWQKPVIEKLKQLSNVAPPAELTEVFTKLNQGGAEEFVNIGARLFTDGKHQSVPNGFQAVSCRDWAEETQVVANRIAKLVERGTNPEHIAIYYPAGHSQLNWLGSALIRQGIAVSNLPTDESVFDWQTQLLRDLITLQLDDVPPMGYHSVLVNPLMPWAQSSKNHTKLNRILKFDDNAENIANELAEGLYALIHQRVDTADALFDWLSQFSGYLATHNLQGLTTNRWNELVSAQRDKVSLYSELTFEALCHKCLNQLVAGAYSLSREKCFYLNAVLAVSSNECLPSNVEHLFWVGFNEGHFNFHPSQFVPSAIFDIAAWKALGFESALLAMQEAKQDLLKFNLSKANASLTVTASRQSFDGTAIELSEIALDLALCFQSAEKVDPITLFKSVDALSADFLDWQAINIAPNKAPDIQDLQFDCDLLAMHTTADKQQRPESPSSLAKLMISPLEWLLSRQGLEDVSWQVQTLDHLLQGNIAHKVFELYQTYQPNQLTDSEIDTIYEKALNDVAPFILQPQWRLERVNLRQEIKQALTSFIEWLSMDGWRLEQVEQRLAGTLWGIPVKGFADAILSREQAVLILDYKTSKSEARFTQLDSGYDLQTYIYRQLLAQQTGNKKIISGYYTLNDRTLVLDGVLGTQSKINMRVPAITQHEQSQEAVGVIQQRLKELRQGFIQLNKTTDEKHWKQFGIKFYGLENNVILNRFLIREDKA